MFSCTTAQHIYRTNCTVCNWTVLTVITQKLLLHVQLHNNTTNLLFKYRTNCTVCNWTVLTVITQKLLLHVQLHNSTTHLPYKLYSLQLNCTYSNNTEAGVMFSCTTGEKMSNWYLLTWNAVVCFGNACRYRYPHRGISSFKVTLLFAGSVSPIW